MSNEAVKGATNAVSRRRTGHLYRGVHAGYPALAAAMRGRVVPSNLNGTVTAEEYNLGGLAQESPFTSWTRRVGIAQQHANKEGPGDVLLRVREAASPPGAIWAWEWSPDELGERNFNARDSR